jgi:tetrapyrrole methylase family protein / MazG family protein
MPSLLDSVFATLHIDPLDAGVQIVPAAQIAAPAPFSSLVPFASTRPLLICGLADRATLLRVQAALRTLYPDNHELRVVSGEAVVTGTVAQLDQALPGAGLCAYLPAQPVLAAVRSFDTLREITARLRAPDGCPWDRQQTHDTLKPFVLEETYEVLEALDSGNRAELCEELGDLIMQVMIHAQVGIENGEFDINDVLAGISGKLMRRHPHVFGDVQVSGAQEVLRNWQSIKQAEKKSNGDEPPASLLGGVPVQLPALAFAQAIQERAGRVGFLQATAEAAQTAGAALAAMQQAQTADETFAAYGDLLFALALLGRRLGVAAEDALRMANQRNSARFKAVEALCRERGLDMQALDETQRSALWAEAVAQQ